MFISPSNTREFFCAVFGSPRRCQNPIANRLRFRYVSPVPRGFILRGSGEISCPGSLQKKSSSNQIFLICSLHNSKLGLCVSQWKTALRCPIFTRFQALRVSRLLSSLADFWRVVPALFYRPGIAKVLGFSSVYRPPKIVARSRVFPAM